MNILAVDTAGKTAGVALLQDDRLLYEVYLDAGMTHSETLMPMIDTCLKMCGMTCADIDLYGVNAGPGSFTGLRIGLAAVKGLAFPRETLCAPVSTLEALAAAHTGEGTVLCALDARRAQVYSAAFDLATHGRLLEDDARAVADLADFVENCKKPLFFVGGNGKCVPVCTLGEPYCAKTSEYCKDLTPGTPHTAMKMISSAKMHKAEQNLSRLVPFRNQLQGIMGDLMQTDAEYTSELTYFFQRHLLATAFDPVLLLL